MIATIACRWVGWAQERPGMAKNAGSTARIGVARSGLWWKPWGQREIMRSWGTSVGAHRRWTHVWGAGRQTTPTETRRGAQSREAGSRPGGGVPFLMRCRRILRTCAGSVITAMIFMGLWHRGQHRGAPAGWRLLPPGRSAS
jgi:hypothetical protein